MRRIRILGVPVDHVTMEMAITYVDDLVKSNVKGKYVLAINPEKVLALERNPFLKSFFENASLLIPDGIGVVMAMRFLYGLAVSRVPGVELMTWLCHLSAVRGYRVYIYGSKEKVNKTAVDYINRTFHGIRIVGRSHGYIRKEQMVELLSDINKSEADILFVALGSPRQEKWIHKYLSQLNIKVCQGIGGTLDVMTGYKKRAPKFFCNAGLEWFYRLVKEPKRIQRQLVLPVFAVKIINEKLKRGQYLY